MTIESLVKILIVDDQPITSYVVDKLLKFDRPDIEIISLRHGKEAIEWFNNEFEPIDVIFLDMYMPIMDGKQFLKWYSSTEYSNTIPVALYSTTSQVETMSLLREYNFIIDSLEKPISIERLLELEKKVSEFKEKLI